MNTNQPQRYGGLLGVAAGVLGLLGGAMAMTVEFMPEAADAVATFTNDGNRIMGGAQLLVVGAILLAAFGATARKRIHTAAPDNALATMAATGYGLAGLAASLGAMAFAGGALRVDAQDTISEAQATTMSDIGSLALGGATPAALALAVGATSLAAVRFENVLPRWLGLVGLPIAVGLLILPINWAVLPVGALWTIVAGAMFSSTSEPTTVTLPGRVRTTVGV